MKKMKPNIKIDVPEFTFKNDLLHGRDWEVFCLVVFNGNVEFLIYQEPSCVYQISSDVFQLDSIIIPDDWRTKLSCDIIGVPLVCGPSKILRDIRMLPEFVDMNPEAISHLRSLLQR